MPTVPAKHVSTINNAFRVVYATIITATTLAHAAATINTARKTNTAWVPHPASSVNARSALILLTAMAICCAERPTIHVSNARQPTIPIALVQSQYATRSTEYANAQQTLAVTSAFVTETLTANAAKSVRITSAKLASHAKTTETVPETSYALVQLPTLTVCA
jgi:hypothetical protein